MSRWSRFAAIVTALLSVGCSTKPPSDVTVISDFQLPEYLGHGTKLPA